MEQSRSSPQSSRRPRPYSDAGRNLCGKSSATDLHHTKRPTITDVLTNDHRSIVRDLELLRAIAKRTKPNGRRAEVILFNRIARSLDEHFRKEEQLLFPLVGSSLGLNACDTLRREHLKILNIAKIRKRVRPLESFARLEQLLRAHISTEENVLFWYVELQSRHNADRPARTGSQ